ncbi:MAG: hypothetical protein HYX26_06630 [Acidobacteriales bacterium]|nr:hypothetical protein [Terriglobales bacterium]
MSEDDLILYHYGEQEAGAREAMDQHLQECAECAAEFERIEQVLAAVTEDSLPVPARGEEYGAHVWARIQTRLPDRARPWWQAWLAPQRLQLAGAFAAVVVIAFLLGRFSKDKPVPDAAISEAGKDRIVLVAVGKHLEKSQMVLVELKNAEPGNGPVDISNEQQRARDLLTANRLYKQSALKVGDPAVNTVLDDLERVLVEIANGPAKLDSAELASIQKRIEAQGLLFKIRVVESKVKKSTAKEKPNASPARTGAAQRSL